MSERSRTRETFASGFWSQDNISVGALVAKKRDSILAAIFNEKEKKVQPDRCPPLT